MEGTNVHRTVKALAGGTLGGATGGGGTAPVWNATGEGTGDSVLLFPGIKLGGRLNVVNDTGGGGGGLG